MSANTQTANLHGIYIVGNGACSPCSMLYVTTQIDKYIDSKIDTQINRQINSKIHRQMGMQMDRQIDSNCNSSRVKQLPLENLGQGHAWSHLSKEINRSSTMYSSTSVSLKLCAAKQQFQPSWVKCNQYYKVCLKSKVKVQYMSCSEIHMASRQSQEVASMPRV